MCLPRALDLVRPCIAEVIEKLLEGYFSSHPSCVLIYEGVPDECAITKRLSGWSQKVWFVQLE